MYDYHNRFDMVFRGLNAYALHIEGEDALEITGKPLGRVIVRYAPSGITCTAWVQFWGNTMAEAKTQSAGSLHGKETRCVLAACEEIARTVDAEREKTKDYAREVPDFGGYPMSRDLLARLIACPAGSDWRNHFESLGIRCQHIL